jgi:hypothetical protein
VHARPDRRKETPIAKPARRILRENGLTLALLALFSLSLLGQALTGWRDESGEREAHGLPEAGFAEYVASGDFVEAVAENWEGEFVQMAAFVWLTSFLFQKGSPESRDPDEPPETVAVTARSPWPVRRGGWIRKLYGSSLTLALVVLYVGSATLHAFGGLRAWNEDRGMHGLPGRTMAEYVTSARFWAESFQNWQSEFLSIALMVVLAIFLRQKGSPESKPVESPHSRNE